MVRTSIGYEHMKYYATVGEETIMVERTAEGVRLPGRDIEFDATVLAPGDAHFVFADRSERVVGVRTAAGWSIQVRGRAYVVELEGERARAIRQLTGQHADVPSADLRAPMPGLVVKVLVETGQTVAEGDGLVVVEAMKMQNELRADGARTIANVEVVPGDTVDRDDVLVRFEETDS
ncbi:MAG: biotin/lipoyl-containing protein [Gemmatimonadota bacterium]